MATLGIYLMGAGLLAVAGIVKAFRPGDTARALAAGLPGTPAGIWRPLVRWLAAAEAVVGVTAVAHPGRVTGAAVAASYLVFTAWILWARAHGGSLATCGCFGTPDTPPTLTHAALDAVVAVGATGIAVAAPSGSLAHVLSGQYLGGLPLLGASILAGWFAYLVMSPLARLGALRAAAPYVPGGRP